MVTTELLLVLSGTNDTADPEEVVVTGIVAAAVVTEHGAAT